MHYCDHSSTSYCHYHRSSYDNSLAPHDTTYSHMRDTAVTRLRLALSRVDAARGSDAVNLHIKYKIHVWTAAVHRPRPAYTECDGTEASECQWCLVSSARS